MIYHATKNLFRLLNFSCNAKIIFTCFHLFARFIALEIYENIIIEIKYYTQQYIVVDIIDMPLWEQSVQHVDSFDHILAFRVHLKTSHSNI